jgi:hypothetical protein
MGMMTIILAGYQAHGTEATAFFWHLPTRLQNTPIAWTRQLADGPAPGNAIPNAGTGKSSRGGSRACKPRSQGSYKSCSAAGESAPHQHNQAAAAANAQHHVPTLLLSAANLRAQNFRKYRLRRTNKKRRQSISIISSTTRSYH